MVIRGRRELTSPWPSMEVRGGRPSLPRCGSVHVTTANDQRSLARDKEVETLVVGGWFMAAVGCARRIWSEGRMKQRYGVTVVRWEPPIAAKTRWIGRRRWRRRSNGGRGEKG